ncbi:Hsp20/alpha crystallin family protein [Cooperia oncophora]
MDLWPVNRLMNRMMYDTMRDMDRFEEKHFPLVNDDKKFAVSLDVSQFRPEQLNVHLEGRELTIEGKQEHKSENSAIHRSFTRKWLLPENVDLEAIRTQLDDKGHLSWKRQRVSRVRRRKDPSPSWPLLRSECVVRST